MTSSQPPPRVLGVLVGEVEHDPATRIEFGPLFAALGRRCPQLDVFDANPRGVPRLRGYGRAARERVEAEFTWDKVAGRLETILQSAIRSV